MDEAKRRITTNPFLVLGLPVTADRAAIERRAQTLLSQLELGFAGASTYETPFGSLPRDAAMVRTAAATLRDAASREVAAEWAAFGKAQPGACEVPVGPPLVDAFRLFGWTRRP
jgi:hypothetical protein